MSKRTEQVNSLLKELIGEYLVEHVEFEPGTLVTVTRVDTPSDLNNANVYVSILPDNRKGSALEVLRKLTGRMDKSLFGKVAMKKVPKLHFKIDEQELYAQQIDAILDTLDKNE
jgi:ribosome-binding factor A